MICNSFIEMLSFIVPISEKDNTVKPFSYVLAEFIYPHAAVERNDFTHQTYFPEGRNIPFPLNNNRDPFVDFVEGLKNNLESFSPLQIVSLDVHRLFYLRGRQDNRIWRQTRWDSDALCRQGVAAVLLRNHRMLIVSYTSVRPHTFQK